MDFTNYDGYDNWVGGSFVGNTIACTVGSTDRGTFMGTLDGRGHSIINLSVGYNVFGYIQGATIKNIAFIGLKNINESNAQGLAYISKSAACTIENVFVSVNQNGSNYQTGIMRETWTTTNIKNVIVVKLSATGTAENYGIATKGPNISNCYAIGANYMKGTDTNGITTAATLLGDTAWLTADNGWNMNVWTLDNSGNLCFGGNTVVSK